MARRTEIIDALVDHLAANTDALISNVIKRFAYLDEVNDFPAITLLPQEEQRFHRGAGRKQGLLSVFVRGYVYDEDDVLGTAETLANQIEEAIETFASTYRTYEVEEARVTTLRTDEGLMKPYGMSDVQIQVLYDIDTRFERPLRLTVDATDILVDSTQYTADATRR